MISSIIFNHSIRVPTEPPDYIVEQAAKLPQELKEKMTQVSKYYISYE
jgi:hypothetical protein